MISLSSFPTNPPPHPPKRSDLYSSVNQISKQVWDKGKRQAKHTPLTTAMLPTHPTTHHVSAQAAAAGRAVLLLQRGTPLSCGTAGACQPLPTAAVTAKRLTSSTQNARRRLPYVWENTATSGLNFLLCFKYIRLNLTKWVPGGRWLVTAPCASRVPLPGLPAAGQDPSQPSPAPSPAPCSLADPHAPRPFSGGTTDFAQYGAADDNRRLSLQAAWGLKT